MQFAHAHRALPSALALLLFSIVSAGPVFAAAPRITGIPNTTVTAGASWSFQPTATDADDHKLTFSVVNAPPFASFSPSTGKLSGVPHTEQARVYSNIVISVTDGTNRVSLPAFSLVVEPTAKQPPATVPTPDSLESSNSAHDGSGSMPPPQSTAIGQDDPYVPTEESADNDAQEGSGTTGAVTLSWTPPTSNADGSALTDLAGYRIVYGRDEGALTETIEVRNPGISNYVVENLSGGTWYFGLKTYNTNGSEGPLSRVVTRIVQ